MTPYGPISFSSGDKSKKSNPAAQSAGQKKGISPASTTQPSKTMPVSPHAMPELYAKPSKAPAAAPQVMPESYAKPSKAPAVAPQVMPESYAKPSKAPAAAPQVMPESYAKPSKTPAPTVPQYMPQVMPESAMPMASPMMPQTSMYQYAQPGMPSMPPCMYGYTPGTQWTYDHSSYSDPSDGLVTNDPAAIVTNNPATPGTFLLKELSGYPAYGNPSGNADILYTGNRGVWTFYLPTWLPAPNRLRGQLLISAVLDDHANVPVANYSAQISMNGVILHRGAVPLQHGTPPGKMFTNWGLLTFDAPYLIRYNWIVITNTSSAGTGDWIGLDWMELRLFYL